MSCAGGEGGTPSAKTQDEVAFEQVAGMETGGALNPRPGEAFAEDGGTRPCEDALDRL